MQRNPSEFEWRVYDEFGSLIDTPIKVSRASLRWVIPNKVIRDDKYRKIKNAKKS